MWFDRLSRRFKSTRSMRRQSRALAGLTEKQLEERILLSAPAANNVLVSQHLQTGEKIYEYSLDGNLVQTFDVEYGGGDGSYPQTETVRDIVMDADGNIQIYNGTFSAFQSELDPVSGTYNHRVADGFSTANNVSYGGIATKGDFVFVTDMETAGAESEGLIRFDRTDDSSTPFAVGEGYIDVELGLDGNLYAVREVQTTQTIDVFDPDSLTLMTSIDSDVQDIRHATATTDGRVFAVSWTEQKILELNAAGETVKELELGTNPQDVDIRADGTIVVGGRLGIVYVTDLSLDSFTDFNVGGDGQTFVSFTRTPPTLSVSDVNVSEDDGMATVTIDVAGTNSEPIEVSYMTEDDTAIQPGDYASTSGTITIPAHASSVTVPVTIEDDSTDEPDESFRFAISSDDAAISDPEAVITIQDNDDPAILNTADVTVSESAGMATVTFTLESASGFDVEIDYATAPDSASTDDFESQSGTVTIPAGQSSVSVDIVIVNDTTHEPSQQFFVDITDATDASVNTSQSIVTITDNDLAPLLTVADLEVNEADGTAELVLMLSEVSEFEVSVDVATMDGTAMQGSDFMPVSATVDIPVGEDSATIAVTLINDDYIESPEAFSVTLTNFMNAQPPLNLPQIQIADDDVAGFSITETDGATTVSEDGTIDSFDVTLDARPVDDVVLQINVITDELSFSDAALTFTTDDWNQPQTISVSGEDDDTVDGDQEVTVAVAVNADESDSDFGLVTAQNVVVTNVDNDLAGLTITEANGSTALTEGADADTVDIALAARPESDVVVDITDFGAAGPIDTDPDQLTFTPQDWNQPQTVTFMGIDNDLAEGDKIIPISFAVNENSNSDFLGLTEEISVTLTDDEVPGFTLEHTAESTEVSEDGNTDSISAVLNARPLTDVVLDFTENDEISIGTTSLTFEPENWDTPQVVSISAVNDLRVDGPQTIVLQANVNAASDGLFVGASGNSLDVEVADDDIPLIALSNNDGSLTVNEAGETTDLFFVTLATIPRGDVVVQVVSSVPAEANVASANALTFTPDTWDTPQSVDVTAADDDFADGNTAVEVTVSVIADDSDESFHDAEVATIVATVVDNEIADFFVTETDDNTTVQDDGTSTDTVDVVLTARPVSNVVILVESRDEDLHTTTTPSLTFTPDNWNTAQSAVVVGTADDTVNGNASAAALFTVDDSSAAAFVGLSSKLVNVNVNNDDTAGFNVTPTALQSEEGMAGTVDVMLTGRPQNDVILTIASADENEVTAAATALTFTNANWDAPQTVTITSVDDTLIDGTTETNVTVSVAAGSDAFFNSVAAQDVTVTTLDNDENTFVADIDGDNAAQPLTDGLLLIRYLAGFQGETLTANAVNSSGSRTDPSDIANWIAQNQSQLDIDGDGSAAPLTDGILFIRYLAGFRGDQLINNAVSSTATRTTAPEIEAWIAQLIDQPSGGNGGGTGAAMKQAADTFSQPSSDSSTANEQDFNLFTTAGSTTSKADLFDSVFADPLDELFN